MSEKSMKTYKYRIYPDEIQRAFLEHTFGCARMVHNLCVEQVLEANQIRKREYDEWKKNGKEGKVEYSVGYPGSKYAFSSANSSFFGPSYYIKNTVNENGYQFLKEVDSLALYNTANDVAAAYDRHVKNKEMFGLPSFQRKNSECSYSTQRVVKDEYKYDLLRGNVAFDFRYNPNGHEYPAILLPKFGKKWGKNGKIPGWIRVNCHRDFRISDNPCYISQVTVSKDCRNHYYISLLIHYQKPLIIEMPSRKKEVGIDFGIKTLATTSDGTEYDLECRKKLRRIEEHIAKYQRKLKLCKKVVVDGEERASENYKELLIKINKLKGQQNRIREYELHKLSKDFVFGYDNIYVSGVDVKTLKQTVQSTSTELTNRVVNKINHKTDENGIGSLRQKISYKSEMYGVKFIALKEDAPVTKTCFICGKLHETEIKEGTPKWICEYCGAELKTKENSARNILSIGRNIKDIDAYNEEKKKTKKSKLRSSSNEVNRIYELIKAYNETHSEDEKMVISKKKIKGIALASVGEKNPYSDDVIIQKIKEMTDKNK